MRVVAELCRRRASFFRAKSNDAGKCGGLERQLMLGGRESLARSRKLRHSMLKL